MIVDFPDIDPIAFSLWFIDVRWYGLSYAAGCLVALMGSSWLAKRQKSPLAPQHFYDVFTFAIFGIIVGGRLGFVLFYEPAYYFANPLKIPAVWEGGMAFHGAAVGLLIAGMLYARRKQIPLLAITDTAVVFIPIGIALGRIANFINGEHWGRPTSADFGMIFPWVDQQPRHPSQLYEAFAEGILLFVVLFFVTSFTKSRLYLGLQTGLFFVGYGIARSWVELFRTPDWSVAITPDIFITSGQILSLPMIIGGLLLCFYAVQYNRVTTP